MDFSRKLTRRADEPMLIAAHRGVSGGNIPCNTTAAFNIALLQGADIVELDVSRSLDGVLYTFHPGMEEAHLKTGRLISSLSAQAVEALRFVNQDDVITHYRVNTLEESLCFLKGRCYINIDKFWTHTEEISAMVRKCGVEKQVIVKTRPEEKYLAAVERYASDLMYMSVVSESDDRTDELLRRDINFIGAEVLFSRESAAVVSDEYINYMHDNGLLLWGNAIVYNERDIISAGHTDDIALTEDMDKGWGWFRDKGFDILQTDWVRQAREYLS